MALVAISPSNQHKTLQTLSLEGMSVLIVDLSSRNAAGNNFTSIGAAKVIGAFLSGSISVYARLLGLDHLQLDASQRCVAALPIEIRSGFYTTAAQYVKDILGGSAPTFRNKVIFVGLQAVGKTSLYNSLFPLAAQFSDSESGHVSGTISLYGPNLFFNFPNSSVKVLLSPGFDCNINKSVVSVLSHGAQASINTTPRAFVFIQALEDPEFVVDQFLALKAALSRTSVSFSLDFGQEERAQAWFLRVSHWTNNQATEGISTAFYEFPMAPGRNISSHSSKAVSSARSSAINTQAKTSPVITPSNARAQPTPAESGTDVTNDDEYDEDEDDDDPVEISSPSGESDEEEEATKVDDLNAINIVNSNAFLVPEIHEPKDPTLQLCFMDFAGQNEYECD